MSDPRLARITARMVLTHTAGFPNWSLDAPLPILFLPGTRWQYSSEGYVYLQRALERRLGETLEPFMQRSVFSPLAMRQSSYATARGALAHGYDGDGQREVETLYDQLKRAGVKLESEVYNRFGRGSRFFGRTPGGVQFEIITREDMESKWDASKE